jgi:superfamily I DNA and/or RNA helicase/very-short-patch-repair endonuclease
LDDLRKQIERWRVFYKGNSKGNSSFIRRILWGFNLKNRIEKSEEQFSRVNELFEKYSVESIGSTYVKAFDHSVETANVKLEELMSDVGKIASYGQKLFELSNSENLYELSFQEIELKQSISDNSLRFWQLWLELLPNRLNEGERKLIGDYITVLELIVKSDEEKRFVNKGVWAKYYKLLPQITNILSCWAVTSLSVRSKVPFEPSFFDVVIIDEASQCDIASALPLLYRAKRAVIIGDDKQLTHISAIPAQEDNQLLEKHDLIDNFLVWSYASSSLFRLAASLCDKMDIVQLKDHHRSHADIINYSNKYFYDGSLRVATNYDRLKSIPGESAVRWIDVKGAVEKPVSGGAINKKEIDAVVKELKRIVETGYEGTIGVVTPFRGHANMIRDKVYADQILHFQLINRDFVVDTVHKFQGDERDIMIFSSVLSNGIKPGTESFLSRNGNLFNVALTRARATLIVIGDMNACMTSSVTHFSQFAKYVQSLKASMPIESNFTSNYGAKYPKVGGQDVVSDWEKVLYERLFAEGIYTLPQYKIDKYSLDLALIIDDRRLDIEIDGETYHRGWDGELLRRDKIRNSRLIELGWDVQRFWVYEIRDDMESCIRKIQNWISNVQLTQTNS